MSRTDNRDIFKVTNGVGVGRLGRVSDTPNITTRRMKMNNSSSGYHERCEC
jgi:hypothetical protein